MRMKIIYLTDLLTRINKTSESCPILISPPTQKALSIQTKIRFIFDKERGHVGHKRHLLRQKLQVNALKFY
jgi:hypothetical protein